MDRIMQRWLLLQGVDVSAVTMIELGNGVAQYKLLMLILNEHQHPF